MPNTKAHFLMKIHKIRDTGYSKNKSDSLHFAFHNRDIEKKLSKTKKNDVTLFLLNSQNFA